MYFSVVAPRSDKGYVFTTRSEATSYGMMIPHSHVRQFRTEDEAKHFLSSCSSALSSPLSLAINRPQSTIIHIDIQDSVFTVTTIGRDGSKTKVESATPTHIKCKTIVACMIISQALHNTGGVVKIVIDDDTFHEMVRDCKEWIDVHPRIAGTYSNSISQCMKMILDKKVQVLKDFPRGIST